MFLSGASSWYGGPRDSQDNDRPALAGASNREPGIAVYNRGTLGGYWRVKFPNGRSLTVRQTDIGPAPWTGKKVDVNYTAVKAAGYTEGNYPNPHVTAEYLGKRKPPTGPAPTAPAAPTPAAPAVAAALPQADDARKRLVLAQFLASRHRQTSPLFKLGVL